MERQREQERVYVSVYVHLLRIQDLKLITPLPYQALIQRAFLTKEQ